MRHVFALLLAIGSCSCAPVVQCTLEDPLPGRTLARQCATVDGVDKGCAEVDCCPCAR